MKHDLLSDCLSVINNAERVGKSNCSVPNSNLIKNVLEVIRKAGYIGEFVVEEREISVQLFGKINRIRVIKPRFSIGSREYDSWERRYLPAKNMGILIISTSKGVMSQKEAIKNGLGGKLLGFVY